MVGQCMVSDPVRTNRIRIHPVGTNRIRTRIHDFPTPDPEPDLGKKTDPDPDLFYDDFNKKLLPLSFFDFLHYFVPKIRIRDPVTNTVSGIHRKKVSRIRRLLPNCRHSTEIFVHFFFNVAHFSCKFNDLDSQVGRNRLF